MNITRRNISAEERRTIQASRGALPVPAAFFKKILSYYNNLVLRESGGKPTEKPPPDISNVTVCSGDKS